MAIDLWTEKCTESYDRKITPHAWASIGECEVYEIMCNEWTKSFAHHIRRGNVRPMSRVPQKRSLKSARQVASKIRELLLARADVFVPVLNPSLQSALEMLGGVKNLTSPELFALNSLIGRGSIEKEFDIEEFYAELDETDV